MTSQPRTHSPPNPDLTPTHPKPTQPSSTLGTPPITSLPNPPRYGFYEEVERRVGVRIEVDPNFNTTATRLPLWDNTCLGADRTALRAAARFLRRLAREGGGGGRVKEQRRQQRVVFQLRGASEWGEGGFDEGGDGAAYYEQYYKVASFGDELFEDGEDRDRIEEVRGVHRREFARSLACCPAPDPAPAPLPPPPLPSPPLPSPADIPTPYTLPKNSRRSEGRSAWVHSPLRSGRTSLAPQAPPTPTLRS